MTPENTLTITETHSEAAYDFYNDRDRTKLDFERFAASRGVTLFGPDRTYPEYDWADVVMSLFDAMK
jgi:hypothetical protein